MDIKKLLMVHQGHGPLYFLSTGTRYKYTNKQDNAEYTFVKHSEFEFPSHFLLKRKSIRVYHYNVAIPDSEGHLVIFVDETDIVKTLNFL
jgi:hypothetical protein